MTALAGIWRYDHRPDPSSQCRSILSAQLQYGPEDPSVGALGSAAFGRALFRLLPEDRFDVQPLVDRPGQRMLVADARIDNRDEILSRLGCAPGASMSESEILFRAFRAWGEDMFDRLVGDFALALWDSKQQLLTLARDPMGQRPLHYHLGKGFVAFASMPSGLHALDEVECAADLGQLASFVADIPLEGSGTLFKGIARVAPGSLVKITPGGVREERFWRMPDRELRFPRQSDYVEAFREQLDRATRSRLRRARGKVGAHLSGGLDSGAVAATAARLLAPQCDSVVAFTSAPRLGFDGPVPRGRVADESSAAAQTAALYPNMEHLVLRPSGASPLDDLSDSSRLFQEPVGHPCNQLWLSAVHRKAQERGVSVMLTGEVGNLTISAGGIGLLADLIRTGRWLRWWAEARSSAGTDDLRWRAVLAQSFGPWVPTRLWNLLTRLHNGYRGGGVGVSFLLPNWGEAVAAAAMERARGGRPEKDHGQVRFRLLQEQDSASFKKGALARWQIEERDPTADRRLAEFSLALPPDQLIQGGQTRRLARAALADRLPPAILTGGRGYQFADWYESLSRERLRAELDALQRGPAASLLDFARLRDVVERWPAGGWETQPVISTYRLALLRALSAARFAEHACQ
jgi:asparagine synthase (glutamine-hydrolysing)